MNTSFKTRRLVLSAMFAALCCVFTLAIRIPIPVTGGFIHPGDGFVILSGVVLGPVYGFLAAGIGSAMANVIGGHILWAPATLIIKGSIALLSGLIYYRFGKTIKTKSLSVMGGGVVDMVLVAGGYLLYEFGMVMNGVLAEIPELTGLGAGGIFAVLAITSIPFNLIQGLSGLIIAVALHPIFLKIPGVMVYGEIKAKSSKSIARNREMADIG